jgi:hypothetical protein
MIELTGSCIDVSHSLFNVEGIIGGRIKDG